MGLILPLWILVYTAVTFEKRLHLVRGAMALVRYPSLFPLPLLSHQRGTIIVLSPRHTPTLLKQDHAGHLFMLHMYLCLFKFA